MKLTSDLGDKVIPHLTSASAREVRQQLELNKNDVDNLKQDLNKTKVRLESSLAEWAIFERSYEVLSTWVADTERRLASDTEPKTDLAEKRAQLDKFKVTNL